MKKICFILSTLFIFSCSQPHSSDAVPTAPDDTKTASPVTPPVETPNPAPELPPAPELSPDVVKVGPRFSRVIYLVFENEDQKQVITDSYYKLLASRGAYFTNFKGEIHPSQGNYIAMVAGDSYNITSDGKKDLNVPHLGDLLENKKLTWKAYAEGYPGNCFLGSSSGKYARKHVPFLSFINVSQNSKRCANIVNEKTFFSDWKANKLPQFSMYIPNLNNDGHDTSIAYSSAWLKKNFEAAFNDPVMMKDTLVVLTYDESTNSGGNKIYTALLGPMIKPGSTTPTAHTHYSLLKLIEGEWGLGSLNRLDAASPDVTGIWK